MKNAIVALGVGFLFSLGLGISGMTQPQKIIGFLDLFGNWDPSLIFVMMSAIGIHFVSYRIIRRRKLPILANQWYVPTKTEITPALVIGAFIFGVGWALGGFCPGPAVTALASFELRPFIFVISMLIGIFIFQRVDAKWKFRK